MPRCLVLGGQGFIGTHLCEALAAAGHSVRSFDRPHPGHLTGRTATGPIERVHGDFLNREDVTRAIRGCEVVFHLICTTLLEVPTTTQSTMWKQTLSRPSGCWRPRVLRESAR